MFLISLQTIEILESICFNLSGYNVAIIRFNRESFKHFTFFDLFTGPFNGPFFNLLFLLFNFTPHMFDSWVNDFQFIWKNHGYYDIQPGLFYTLYFWVFKFSLTCFLWKNFQQKCSYACAFVHVFFEYVCLKLMYYEQSLNNKKSSFTIPKLREPRGIVILEF